MTLETLYSSLTLPLDLDALAWQIFALLSPAADSFARETVGEGDAEAFSLARVAFMSPALASLEAIHQPAFDASPERLARWSIEQERYLHALWRSRGAGSETLRLAAVTSI